MKSVIIPNFIYGTAWKETQTTKLVEQAIQAGFTAIDTANQIKHYAEALVGDAAKKFRRDELWLQTKFTSVRGQHGEKPPYDPTVDLTTQVKQSFASSLEHLKTDYVDSYLLHGPYNHPSLGREDFEVWQAIEAIYKSGKTKSIGVSNMNIYQMKMLVENAEIKPMMLQNRCYANRGWDKEVREFCKAHAIKYQGFSLLTANVDQVNSDEVMSLARKYKVDPAQIIFRFAYQVGMIPITGTTNSIRMKKNLTISDFELTVSEIELIENIG